MPCGWSHNTLGLSAPRFHVVPSIGKRGQIQLFNTDMSTFNTEAARFQLSHCSKALQITPQTLWLGTCAGGHRSCWLCLPPLRRYITDGFLRFEPCHTLSRPRDDHNHISHSPSLVPPPITVLPCTFTIRSLQHSVVMKISLPLKLLSLTLSYCKFHPVP